ncbi:MAG: hypothetical protein OEY52_00725 [Gammaproteobacteria bacterium]|nr:hypothetical protein [Gammaproteobacteria bacterium]
MYGCRLTCAIFVFTLLANTTAIAAPASNITPHKPSEDDLLILGIKIDHFILEEVFPAYRQDSDIYLPLGILSQILDIAIKVDLGTGSAEGFIVKESRQFHLDVSRQQVTLSGKLYHFPKEQVYVYPDDIYINSALLEKWWPMLFDTNLFTSRLIIKTTEPLPFQSRLIREREIAKIKGRFNKPDRGYDVRDTEYGLISAPFIDQRVSAHYGESPYTETKQSYSYSTYVKADLLYHETSLYISGNSNDDNKTESHLTASRSDPESRLLGPMKATNYSFIDIVFPGLEHINNSKTGIPGISIKNYPLKQQTHFDKHTFEGELLPNWEVELYHNNTLIGYKDKTEHGKYRFEDIPLLFGHNYFKLVFYGPHGESREETHTFSLTGALTKPGSYYYDIIVAKENGGNKTRTLVKQDFGLSKYLTAQLNFVSIPVEDNTTVTPEDKNDYMNLSLNGFWSSLFYRYNYIKEVDGGEVNEISLQNRIGRTNLKASATQFKEFYSERYNATDPILQQQRMRIDTVIPPWWLPHMPIGLEIAKEEYTSGHERTQYITRIAVAKRGLALSNTLTRTESTVADTTEFGVLSISTHNSNFSLRSELYYENKPESRLNTINMNFSGRYLYPYSFNLGINKFEDDQYQYLAGLNKQFGNYSLTTTTKYKTTGEWAVDMAFSISLGRDPRLQNWHTQALPMATNGSVSILVFFDANQNGIRDHNEKGLPNIAFHQNNSIKQKKTDKDGFVLFTDLPAHESIELGVDIASLEDPLMIPSTPGVRITPRPGHIDQINFPIILTGEIDGNIYLRKKGKNIPVGDIEMVLTDMEGKIIQKIKSAYDGFYVMSKIPAGTYLMKLSSKEASKYGLKDVVPREINIKAENPFISGVNFILFKDTGNKENILDIKPQ